MGDVAGIEGLEDCWINEYQQISTARVIKSKINEWLGIFVSLRWLHSLRD